MSDTDRLHRAGEYLRKQEQHQHADAVDQACSDLDNLRTRIQEVLLLDTGQNRRLYGLDFEAGMVKALCIVHSILNPGSPIADSLSRITDAEQRRPKPNNLYWTKEHA